MHSETILKYGSLAAFVLISLSVGTQSALAGNITVEQKSPVELLGDWKVSMPSGTTAVSHIGESVRTIASDVTGTHLIKVTPPEKANTFITIISNEGTVASASSPELQTVLESDKDYRVIITYKFTGTVTVNSEPQGAPFQLVGPPKGYNRSGVTPATFSDLPPYYYTVRYGRMDGCGEPKPQKREETRAQHTVFNAKYVCDKDKATEADDLAPPPEVISLDGLPGNVSVWLSPHQTEINPGDEVTYTLGARNNSKRTQHNVQVSFQFDPSVMNIEKTLPKGGKIKGNIAVWNVPEIYAGKSWAIKFPVRIRETVARGVQMQTSARVSGEEVNPDVSKVLSARTTVGTAAIPQSGERTDLMLILMSMMVSLTMLTINRRRRRSE